MSASGNNSEDQVELASGETLHSELGGFRLSISLLDNEWQVRTIRASDPPDASEWRQWREQGVPVDDSALQRFIRAGESGRLEIRPALADLPVVIRPYHPVHIPPESDVTFYVSTIVWLQLVIDTGRVLMEVPLRIPSWTWIGSDTMEGEICYGSQTAARLDPATLPANTWRAMSAVTVRNRGVDYLTLERFSFPAPMTPLFRQDDSGSGTLRRLWTPSLTIIGERSLATASIRIEAVPPAEAGPCTELTPARQLAERNHLVRTMDRIFG